MTVSLLMNANTKADTFPFVYRALLETLLDGKLSVEELNERTGRRIRMLPYPASFAVDLRDGLLPVTGNRKLFPKTAAAEVAWFLQGERDVTWLRQYAPIWDKFVEDDGVTIEAAYGYRWRNHFGRDQLIDAVSALQINPSDRRVVVSAWDPGSDGLGRPGKNVPCPTHFTLSIVNGRLNSALFIRSSDVFVGLPYDVMGHAFLMAAIVQELGLEIEVGLGTMHVTLAHPHLYDSHFEIAAESLEIPPVLQCPGLPSESIQDILGDPDAYVERVADLAADVVWPEFCPRPEVVQ